jgi:hypothetical protein
MDRDKQQGGAGEQVGKQESKDAQRALDAASSEPRNEPTEQQERPGGGSQPADPPRPPR